MLILELLAKVCYKRSKSIQLVGCATSQDPCLVCNASCMGTLYRGDGCSAACRSRTGANINILTKGFMLQHTRCTFWGKRPQRVRDSNGRLHLQSAECTAIQWSVTGLVQPYSTPTAHSLRPYSALTLSVSSGNFRSLPHFLTLQRHFQMLI